MKINQKIAGYNSLIIKDYPPPLFSGDFPLDNRT